MFLVFWGKAAELVSLNLVAYETHLLDIRCYLEQKLTVSTCLCSVRTLLYKLCVILNISFFRLSLEMIRFILTAIFLAQTFCPTLAMCPSWEEDLRVSGRPLYSFGNTVCIQFHIQSLTTDMLCYIHGLSEK